MVRLRVTFEKNDALRYTSHLDTQKVWTRALLRAKAPLAYTQGFHPVPKVGYAWPLPLGWSTKGELIDIWLDMEESDFDSEAFISKVNEGMPAGLRIVAVEVIELYAEALTNVIQSAEYLVKFPDGVTPGQLQEKMENLCAQETIEHERRGKMIDLKPLIEGWTVLDVDGSAIMRIRMAARNAAMGRPDELVTELCYNMFEAAFERTRYIL